MQHQSPCYWRKYEWKNKIVDGTAIDAKATSKSILTVQFDCERQIIEPICWWPIGPRGYNFLQGLLTTVVTFTNHVTLLQALQCNWILKIQDALSKAPSGLVLITPVSFGTSIQVACPLFILKCISQTENNVTSLIIAPLVKLLLYLVYQWWYILLILEKIWRFRSFPKKLYSQEIIRFYWLKWS